MIATDYPAPPFSHLARLTDRGGLHEHAEGTRPRAEHGYCVDDVARALVVVSREPEPIELLAPLYQQYLCFVLDAQSADGRFRNRRSTDGAWAGPHSVEDCWGRAILALAAVVTCTDAARSRSGRAGQDLALHAFERGVRWRSPWSRAMIFAGLGAAELLAVRPDHAGARALLNDVVFGIARPTAKMGWPWPEPRLTYANAALPEVLIAAGAVLGDKKALRHGLSLLRWLLERETSDGHLSVTPVAGSGPGDMPRRRFDQQPIEVASLADACTRAFVVTGDRCWADGVRLAAGWFLGNNDVGIPLLDPDSGGGCDGLETNGRNENQGAESTIALISTLQQVRAISMCPA